MNEPGNPAMYVYGRLAALGLCLQAYGFTVEHVAGGLVVRNPSAPRRRFDQPVVGDTIRCLPRADDGGRYWFFTSWRQPIAEAERVADAWAVIGGYLGTPR
ncbi:hypothetical protein GCM10023085_74430 [Actinomadura viridis]|uniref:Uncharacterized protein n=1 Tax=Actinomadura viridis TaxID=58110 RepID=A0A931DIX9_9ACTN|nr:hypothetical protein [Actinomadura viridis]MBG6087563.1 hypothetical protein [Actinomadura viridis]